MAKHVTASSLRRLRGTRPLFRSAVQWRTYSAESSAPSVLLRRDLPAPHVGHIRVLSLNSPRNKNALSKAMVSSLKAEAEEIADEPRDGPTRAVILHSAVDGVFCAGADLKERRTFTTAETHSFLSTLRDTLTRISLLPVPSIAAIHGPALGGGLELALPCSLRVISTSSVVGLPETRLGIIPGAGGTYRLPRVIGMTRARDLIFTGRRVSGEEASRLGVADRLVEGGAEEVLAEAVQLAKEIAMGGPVAIRAAVEAMSVGGEEGERRGYEMIIETEDRMEALKAFAEKRRPIFKGR